MSDKIRGSFVQGKGSKQVGVTIVGTLKPEEWPGFRDQLVAVVSKYPKLEIREFANPAIVGPKKKSKP